MAVVCIVYDLHTPGQRWAAMDKAIEGLKLNGGRAFNTTWFFATDESPQSIYDRIAHVVDQNDSLIVFRASSPGKWRGLSTEWSAWLKANL
jgi:hypothetical protein